MIANTIDLTATIGASPLQSWAFITVPQHLAAWFGSHIQLDARLGGHMEERWKQNGRSMVTTGLIDVFDPPRLLSMTWADSDWPAQTRVTIRLAERGEHTLLTLSHAGWEGLVGVDREFLREQHEQGWTNHLIALSRYAARLRSAALPQS